MLVAKGRSGWGKGKIALWARTLGGWHGPIGLGPGPRRRDFFAAAADGAAGWLWKILVTWSIR